MPQQPQVDAELPAMLVPVVQQDAPEENHSRHSDDFLPVFHGPPCLLHRRVIEIRQYALYGLNAPIERVQNFPHAERLWVRLTEIRNRGRILASQFGNLPR